MQINQEILKSLVSKNALVTGGTGMIGRQVVDILLEAAANIRIVSLDKIKVNDKAEHIFGDLTNFDFCKKICKDMDFVFHIAGIGVPAQAAKTRIATNFIPMLMMNTNILEACRLNRVQKVVFTSTIGAYTKAEIFRESDYRLDTIPMDFASWTKRMAEAQIYAYNVEYGLDNFAVVRPANVYGPGDNFGPENSLVIPSLMYRIYHKEDPLVVWGDGCAIRDFVYSRDVAEGIILALYYGTNSGFVNLGSGKPHTIRELVEALNSFLNFNYIFDPSKPSGDKKRIMDISLAKRLIHYNPTTQLRDGLKKTWEWFVTHPEEYKAKINYFSGKKEEII